MSVITSIDVVAGDDALAAEYNLLRADVVAVEANSPPIGSIVMWAGDTGDVPTDWSLCDGSAVNRTTYATLFARLAETFGVGDGSTTFDLPDLRDKFVVGAGTTYSRADTGGSDTVNSEHNHTGGAHTHTIPSHSHTGPSHTHSTPGHQHGAGSYAAAFVRAGPYDAYIKQVSCTTWGMNFRVKLSNSYADTSASSGSGLDLVGSSSTGGASTTGSSGTGDTGTWSGATGSSGTQVTSTAGSTTLENRPPYVGLFYIIKIS